MVLNSLTFRDLQPAIALTSVVQVAVFEKRVLEGLLASYPFAQREVRSHAFKLAFKRALVQVASEIARARARGADASILEAFVNIRLAKQRALAQHTQLGEPTRKLLASTLSDLAERTENIAREGETAREQISNQVRALDARVNARMEAVQQQQQAILGAVGAVASSVAALRDDRGGGRRRQPRARTCANLQSQAACNGCGALDAAGGPTAPSLEHRQSPAGATLNVAHPDAVACAELSA
jgi:hypothetical protein